MKGRLKKINIAGTWNTHVEIELHGESIGEVGAYLMELNEEIVKVAKHVANKDKYKVNLKKVTALTKATK